MTGSWPRRARGTTAHVTARIVALMVVATASLAGCGGPSKPAAGTPLNDAIRSDVRRMEGRPPMAAVIRDGDPRGAVALAVSTEGLAPERGADVAAALAALLEARTDRAVVTVTPSGMGVRARGLVANDTEAGALAQALTAALQKPVTAAELPAITHKLALVARRPLADRALDLASKCRGDLVGPVRGATGSEAPALTVETVEEWRRGAAGLGRVALGTTGSVAIADAVVSALARGAVWPQAAPLAADASAKNTEARVYDATGEVPGGGARITLSVRTGRAELAVRAADALGDPHGALATRLGGLEAPARLRDVTATAHARGGCLAVTFDFAPRDLALESAPRIAKAIALARQEIAGELSAGTTNGTPEGGLARRAGDPREAAELAAWWALSSPDPDISGEPAIAAAVGLASGRDAPAGATLENDVIAARATAIRADLDRAIVSWHEPVVETRTAVEAGQGELWLALGSPCGTLAEMQSDAGLGAAFALAAAERTSEALAGTGAHAEAWAAQDGIGVVVHGPALPGETSDAQARRLADAVARSFAAEPVDRAAVAHARARLLGEDEREDARALVTLAEAIAPGHPSWLAPMGPMDALGRSSDAAVAARAAALRAGPLRLAVIANRDASQAEAAVHAVDRWIARRPGDARACPVPSVPGLPRPATYSVDARPGASSQAWLALPLPSSDAGAKVAATWLAASLDGPDGLLDRALGGGLARSWSARVTGGPRASALVIRVDSAPGSIDAAVAQVRGLLDRLHQGSLVDTDRAHAAAVLGAHDLATTLDPSHRLRALWTNAPDATAAAQPAAGPALDALRAFATSVLRDDALIIVAVRPPRTVPPPSPPKS